MVDLDTTGRARRQVLGHRAHFEGLLKAIFVDLSRRDDSLEERLETA